MSMFSELINPITPVGAGSKGSAMGNGLGEAADFVETLRKNRAEEAHQNEQDALKEQHQLSTDRYYNSLTAYHQDELKQKGVDAQAKLEQGNLKQALGLLEEHRKAIATGNLEGAKSIRAQLPALGFSVSESASGLPDANAPATPAPSLTPPPPGAWSTLQNGQDEPHAPGYNEGGPTPGGSPFLKNYMASPGASAASAAPAAASSSTALTDLGIGKDIPGEPPASLTLLPSPDDIKPPAPAAPPQGKGKFTVRDKAGNVVSEYDQPLEQAKTQNQVDQIISPYTEGGTPQSNQVWGQIRKSAMALAMTNGVTAKEAVEIASKNAGVELSQFKRQGVGGGGGGEGVDEKHAFKVQAALTSTMKDEDTRNKWSTIKTDHSLLEKAKALLAMPNGPSQTLAAIDLMRMMNGRGGNQAEFTALKGGPWMRFESFMNGVKDENSPMPEALVRDLGGAVEGAEKTLAEHEDQVRQEANDVLDSSIIPFRKGEKEKAQKQVEAKYGKPTVTPSQPNAPAGDARAAAMEELRKAREAKKAAGQ